MAQDDFSPIYAGDTGAPFAPQFRHKDGSVVNLTGATITMKMLQEAVGGNKTGAGTWTIDDAINGKAHYVYASGDVDTPGTWDLYITITINAKPVHADTKQLVILPAP